MPSYISMYEYIPANLAASPPIVVAAHYCGGSASAFFGAASSIVSAADKYGFIMIFPQTTNPATSAKCWDVGSKASLTHDGGGDTQAIAQMVEHEIATRNADAERVYIMGASSGAMLTEAMLAVYPDVFKAGAEFSGVPAGCWSAGWSAASNWGGTCAGGRESKTSQQWGDLVRGMYPGYSGYRPRIQLWHGTSDTTININNQTEAIKQWTNVLGLPMTPTSTDSTSVPAFKIEKWSSACGFTVLEAHTQNNGGHSTPIDANAVISFFGLDKSGPDPQIAACGSSGSGGSGGSAGAMAADSGGMAAAGGGGALAAGSGAMAAGSGATAGGGAVTGGNGAIAGSGGVGGNRGVSAGGAGGRVDMGMPGSAGRMVLGTAGQAVIGTADANGVAGASGNLGTGVLPIGTDSGPSTSGESSGCNCAVESGHDGSSGIVALMLTTLVMIFGRRRRPTKQHAAARDALSRRPVQCGAGGSVIYPVVSPELSCVRLVEAAVALARLRNSRPCLFVLRRTWRGSSGAVPCVGRAWAGCACVSSACVSCVCVGCPCASCVCVGCACAGSLRGLRERWFSYRLSARLRRCGLSCCGPTELNAA